LFALLRGGTLPNSQEIPFSGCPVAGPVFLSHPDFGSENLRRREAIVRVFGLHLEDSEMGANYLQNAGLNLMSVLRHLKDFLCEGA